MSGYTMEEMAKSIGNMERTITSTVDQMKGAAMSHNSNDLAGLLALMQNNKGMDLPGLLALCKDKGYDRGWGNDFMFIFLLFFLMGNGGWGNWGNRTAAEGLLGGEAISTITSLHDRISAAQAASTNGFQQLQTWLCEAIANVVNNVRNQGDRAVDATRNVGDTVKSCCCEMEKMLATLNCKVEGVSRDIHESTNVLSGKIDLAQERNVNAMQSMECRLSGQIKDLRAETALGFERQACLIRDMAKDAELDRLRRENCDLKLKESQNGQTAALVAAMQNYTNQQQQWAINHYVPTRTTTTTPATGA